MLTHKQLETHEWVFSTVATDALVLKHQAISIHCADCIIQRIWQVSHKNIIFTVNFVNWNYSWEEKKKKKK